MDSGSHFVDRNMDVLIQRVALVMPLADVLLSKKMLSYEAYSEIKAERTSQRQMRALYKVLEAGGFAAKNAVLDALKEQNPYLVQELDDQSVFTEPENKYQTAAPALFTNTSRKRKNPFPDTWEGEANVDNMKTLKTNLKQRWQKHSKRWEQQLNLLLDDSDLQNVGNLFLSMKKDYKIGDGADGTRVYLGMKADGTEVAIKRMIEANNGELKNEMSLLQDPHLESSYIVRYVDFEKKGEFNYLAFQLCEYNLDDYMNLPCHKKNEEDKMKTFKKLARDVLLGLEVLHKADVLHRDLKPQNVLIDVKGNARLGDFGISRRLNRGVSTRCTTKAGTKGWEAAEILDSENQGEAQCRYKKSSDIQVAGMLVYYILSDGHHPFGKSRRVEVNIMDGKHSLQEITDVEAKDLIKEMIQNDPKQRVTIEEALGHPYFWDDERRDAFLRKVAGEKAVQSFSSADEKLRSVVAKYTEGRTFSSWKSKVPQELSPDPKLPDDLLGLLRFLRNILVHKADVFEKNNMFKDLFPDFFISAHKLAKEMGWKA